MLTYALVGLALASLGTALQKCKCLPGDPCFPSQAQLDAFSANLSHPLIIGQRPLASVCYPNSSNFVPTTCASLKANANDPLFLAAQSNALQYQNLEALITNGSVHGCPFDPAPGGICFQGRVPSYSINVSTVADIQNTIEFATRYNLHLVVKNAG